MTQTDKFKGILYKADQPGSHLERIQIHLTGSQPITLTAFEEEMMEHLNETFTLLLNYTKKKEIARILEHKHGVHFKTAYQWMRMAVEIFGDVEGASKQGLRHMITEMSLEMAAQCRQEQKLDKAGRHLDRILRVNNLDKDDPDLPNFADLTPHTIKLTIPPGTLKDLQAMLKAKGSFNLDEPVIDVPHEEVKE